MKHEYRLYYREDGSIICYTMENLPGNYLVIDAATYSEAPLKVKVADGKLVRLGSNKTVAVYRKNTDGVKTSKYDINVLVDAGPCDFWSITTNDNNTNSPT